MAAKGVTTQAAVAAGVAAATGAAQLGLGYGLGVVVWPVTLTLDDSVWLGSLGWATWIAASSTVFGAMIGITLGSGRPARPSGPLRLTIALGAGTGALLTVALVALPARSAVRADALPPQTTAAIYALIGIALGIVIAYWAVVSAPVAANLIATSVYLWTLAAIAIVVELTGGRPAATYLTSWQFAPLGDDQRYGTIYWPSALITVFAAFLIGIIAAMPAVRRGDLGLGTALSGAVGPVLVAAAFLLLAPQLTGALGPLQSAYLIAPYAVLSGLAGSALAVSHGQRLAQRRHDDLHRSPPAASGAAAVPAGQGRVPADQGGMPAGQRGVPAGKDDEPTAELGPRRFGRVPRRRGERNVDDPREGGRAGESGTERSAEDPRGGSLPGERGEDLREAQSATQPGVGSRTGGSRTGRSTDDPREARRAAQLGEGSRAAEPRTGGRGADLREAQPGEDSHAAERRDEGRGEGLPRARGAENPRGARSPDEPAAVPARPAPVKPSIAARLRRDKGRTQEDVDTAEIKQPRKSTVAAPPSTPPIAKINPDEK